MTSRARRRLGDFHRLMSVIDRMFARSPRHSAVNRSLDFVAALNSLESFQAILSDFNGAPIEGCPCHESNASISGWLVVEVKSAR
jgi:hypothetical protein